MLTCSLQSSRLANPATSIVQRTAAKDTELGGYFIPKDTLVNIDIIALHYNPRYWKNPEVFDPERFVDGGELDSQSPFPAYMPFGGGIRQCIGK
jgi:cytochrome P450